MELVEADLLKPESFDAAVAGCTYVIHTASPFVIEPPKDENVLIKPAVEGTLAVLRAAHKHRVKRVVITSSVVAIQYRTPENAMAIYDETSWSDIEACDPYSKSKTLAEKAAWEFQMSLPVDERFELVVLNPGNIQGPSIVTNGDFSSGLMVNQFMSNFYPALPKVQMGVVDVRECAHAHLQALKVPEAANQRFILVSEVLWFTEMAAILA